MIFRGVFVGGAGRTFPTELTVGKTNYPAALIARGDVDNHHGSPEELLGRRRRDRRLFRLLEELELVRRPGDDPAVRRLDEDDLNLSLPGEPEEGPT